MNHIFVTLKPNYLKTQSNVTREEQHQINSKKLSHHGRNIDIIDDLTLVEIEKIDYHTFSHVNPPLAHHSNSIILTEIDSLVSLCEILNNMQNITLDPLDSSGVEGTISMQPQMVAGGYQNPLGTQNSCLGSTSGETLYHGMLIFLEKIMHPGTQLRIGTVLHRWKQMPQRVIL